MRLFKVGLAILIVLAASQFTQALRNCRRGDTVTVTGRILSAQQDKRKDGKVSWTLTLDQRGERQCIVDELWGNGRLPPGCEKGRSASASGIFDNDPMLEMADLEAVLEVKSITCK